MTRTWRRRSLVASLMAALSSPSAVQAVHLDTDGTGQALIYPYYTTRSADGNAFNTYVSVVNHRQQISPYATVIRVRFREGRNGREVASFNLYLSYGDVWTATIVPTNEGARLLTYDESCTSPQIPLGNLLFQGQRALDFSSGGEDLDLTREGYVEMIQMASLSGVASAAVTHNSAGIPANCAVVQTRDPTSVSAPTGQLSGTGTLINVASGLDFTYNAEALGGLTTRPFYRNYTDPYPDWNAAEITPVSSILANGKQYRLTWASGLEAVDAVLMRTGVLNEFIRDTATMSRTDWILTFPTRRLHVTPAATTAPFLDAISPSSSCAALYPTTFTREERDDTSIRCPLLNDFGFPCPPAPLACFASTILAATPAANTAPSGVLGSTSRHSATYLWPPNFANGWSQVAFADRGGPSRHELRSLPSSTVRDLATDQVTTGSQVISGLPVLGLMLRTFVNGTLVCASGSCQGNYGGNFPHKYRRQITPAP
jgi:hypothetical protein